MLIWTRLNSGNYAAFDGEGWFYLVGRLGRRWFVEGGPAEDPRTTDTAYGYKTRADAYAEANEQQELAELLAGRYQVTRQAAADAMRKARKTGTATIPVADGQVVVLGIDARVRYTVDVQDREVTA
jgi:hypothetical protein